MSCEPDEVAYKEAVKNTKNYNNIKLYNIKSQDFIIELQKVYSGIYNKRVTFWLDAHDYGFDWPLKEEINFITSCFNKSYVFIDDFKVPGMSCFGYDEYDNQICSFEYIKESIPKSCSFELYYPNYSQKTSTHHPLRGWGLLVINDLKNESTLTSINYLNKTITQ